jgi:hypothetical protein
MPRLTHYKKSLKETSRTAVNSESTLSCARLKKK